MFQYLKTSRFEYKIFGTSNIQNPTSSFNGPLSLLILLTTYAK